VSEWVADQMVDRLGVERTKVRIVPNGVDPSIALAAVGSTPPGSPYLLSVGHLEPRKNQQDLIRALAYLGNRWHGRVILVGRDFGTSTTLQRLATDLGVADRVIFVGEVDEAELARLYRWSSMVICTAEYEGFGMTPLEAFVHQRPVVASSIPTHREVAGAAAFYYDLDGSAEARAGRLGEAILTVLSERDQTTELVKRGCDRTKLFTWDRAAQLLDRVYEECEGRGQ
jgi:glycosyltransferase involved in cell wall biosynthesis